jgi:2-polyprenyl-3-methyl-5-hydroxy-6-metoxy-1,4-benzoquinol methylase
MRNCRICNTPLGKPFLSLGSQPLSNAYLRQEQLSCMEPHYPLDVFLCESCSLVQIDEFEKASTIFSDDYAYFSSCSDSWLAHCKHYCDTMASRFSMDDRWKVVEIASNDGYLLQYFKEKNIPVLGIEPAKKTALEAIRKGIPTEMDYFTSEYARKMAERGDQADLIIGNNVLAHNPDCNDFVRGVQILLKPHGIVTMEFPHVLAMLEKTEFDTIYHEHYSYLGFATVVNLFEKNGLSLFDVEELPTHGGSLRIFAQHMKTGRNPVSSRVTALLEKEKSHGLFSRKLYDGFTSNVEKVKRDLLAFLIGQKEAGRKIAGYGAPAKGNTLLNYCGIRTDFIDYTVDRSPLKQNRFLPGTHIPVFSPEKIRETKPDFLFILPWNIKSEIIEQMDYVCEWGCKYVTAIPHLEIFP